MYHLLIQQYKSLPISLPIHNTSSAGDSLIASLSRTCAYDDMVPLDWYRQEDRTNQLTNIAATTVWNKQGLSEWTTYIYPYGHTDAQVLGGGRRGGREDQTLTKHVQGCWPKQGTPEDCVWGANPLCDCGQAEVCLVAVGYFGARGLPSSPAALLHRHWCLPSLFFPRPSLFLSQCPGHSEDMNMCPHNLLHN